MAVIYLMRGSKDNLLENGRINGEITSSAELFKTGAVSTVLITIWFVNFSFPAVRK
jgi:hypothetical protein